MASDQLTVDILTRGPKRRRVDLTPERRDALTPDLGKATGETANNNDVAFVLMDDQQQQQQQQQQPDDEDDVCIR